MSNLSDTGHDCWLSRVRQLEKMFNIPKQNMYAKKEAAGNIFKKRIHSIFDRFWLDEVTNEKLVDGVNKNKLRFYSTFKASFSREPYFDLVNSRNQRSFLTRIRCSAHRLEIEKLRYVKPVIPAASRICGFCHSGEVGDERHFLMNCETFNVKRACFMGKMASIIPNFYQLSSDDKLKTILCPRSTAAAKVINKFIRIMFLARDNISEGIESNSYQTMPVNICPFEGDYENFSDCDEWEENLSELNCSDFDND